MDMAGIMAVKKQQEILMFGETVEHMEKAYRRFQNSEDLSGRTMYAMSILSDVQHILASNTYDDQTAETARQWLNKAKHFISDVHMNLRQEGK